MPARVHAILVARPGAKARAQLLRTLEAIRSQSYPVEAVTLVMCGDAATARESETVSRTVEGVIEARGTTSFAEAVDLARPRVAAGRAIWLLAHDTTPDPRALEQLSGSLERSPSAALIAPKLVRAEDDREIVSLGVSMTSLGRSVELAAGELDQGQHDGNDDALGADVRGILIRAEARDALRPDRALAGADEGLDLGVRARLAGGRVVLAPHARVAVQPDGPAALPTGAAKRAFVTRLAQLHRRLSYAPPFAVPLHWLSLLPLALWRSITHLIGKRPEAVFPEWGAALTEMVRFGAVARSRRGIRSNRRATWASIAPLRVSRAQLHRRLDDGHGSEGGALSELHFFAGGGAWAVLTALIVSVASFTTLLAWPALGGGALLPLRQTLAALWADAGWGMRGVGIDVVGPADPFAAVVAVVGSLWPSSPSFALVILWVLSLPLAVLGGWFAATRITDSSALRIFAGVVWALAPTFLIALVEGRPAAVLVHLLLPWLFHAGVVAQRSWGAAGAASLLFAAVLACAPSLAPALVVLWLIAFGIALAGSRVRGGIRLIWVLMPAAVLFAPLVVWQATRGSLWALLGDPGSIWAGSPASTDAAGRLALATGFPTPDFAGWASFAGAPLGAWAALLCAPLALLALASPVSPRWRAGITLLVVALAGLGTAFLAVGIQVSFAQGTPVAIWPGSALSLAWIGVLGASLVTLDTALTVPRARVLASGVAAVALAVCAVPALTALHTGRSALTDGPETTLPAYVAAQASGDQEVGTLVLTPQNDGGLAVDVAWGPSATLGAQTTILSTATEAQGVDISALSVDLLSARDFDAPAELAGHGISYVLLAQMPEGEGDKARDFRTAAITALDQRAGFVQAGKTELGVLWRVEAEPAARGDLTPAQRGTAQLIVTVQLVIVFAALLLSIPTRASRRAARGYSRVVGRSPDEPLVLPRHSDASAQSRGGADDIDPASTEAELEAARAGDEDPSDSSDAASADANVVDGPALDSAEGDPTADPTHAEPSSAEVIDTDGSSVVAPGPDEPTDGAHDRPENREIKVSAEEQR